MRTIDPFDWFMSGLFRVPSDCEIVDCSMIIDPDSWDKIGDGIVGEFPEYKVIDMKMATPKRVIFNPPATVVFWEDGTKTIAKCEPQETFDPEKGLMVALLKRIYGNRRFHDIMEQNLPKEDR